MKQSDVMVQVILRIRMVKQNTPDTTFKRIVRNLLKSKKLLGQFLNKEFMDFY